VTVPIVNWDQPASIDRETDSDMFGALNDIGTGRSRK
jgi:hypothetical protein